MEYTVQGGDDLGPAKVIEDREAGLGLRAVLSAARARRVLAGEAALELAERRVRQAMSYRCFSIL